MVLAVLIVTDIFLIANLVYYIVPWVLSGELIIRNKQPLCHPNDKIKDELSTKSIQKNVHPIKLRILEFFVTKSRAAYCELPLLPYLPRAILPAAITTLLPLHPVSLALLPSIPFKHHLRRRLAYTFYSPDIM